MHELKKKPQEFQLFVKMMHQRYADALAKNDADGMMSASGVLCLIYSTLDNAPYAKKWADEFWRLWEANQKHA